MCVERNTDMSEPVYIMSQKDVIEWEHEFMKELLAFIVEQFVKDNQLPATTTLVNK
jgi:hypothetical protein